MAPRLLVVRLGPGEEGWHLTVTVDSDDDNDNDAVVTLRQTVTDPEAASFIGPGWDFYLDRLVDAEEGRDPDTAHFAPDYHPVLAEHYRALVSPV